MRLPISILRSFLIGVMLVGALVFPAQSTAQPPEEGAEPTAGKGHLRFPGSPFAEPGRGFLNRGIWQGYINYGIEPYETYTVSTQSFEVYDRLGNRLLRGYPAPNLAGESLKGTQTAGKQQSFAPLSTGSGLTTS